MKLKMLKKGPGEITLKFFAYFYTLFALIILLYPVAWTISNSLKEDYEIRKAEIGLIPPMTKQIRLSIDYTEYLSAGGENGKQEDRLLNIRKEMAWLMTYLSMSADRESIYGIALYAKENDKVITELSMPKYFPRYIGQVLIGVAGKILTPERFEDSWGRFGKMYKFKDSYQQPYVLERGRFSADEQVSLVVHTALDRAEALKYGKLQGEILQKNSPWNLFDNIFQAVLRFSRYGTSNPTLSGIGRYTLNTVGLSAFAILAQLIINGLAGYALAKLFHRKYSEKLLLFFMTTMMIPSMLTIIPVYLIYSNFKLLDSYWALLLPYVVASPFIIYLFKGFFAALPGDLFEAATIDGAGEISIFSKICIPLSKPIVSVIVMLTFMGVWNEFFWPFLAVQDDKYYTIPLMLYKYQSPGGHGVSQSVVMSLYSLVALPCLLIMILFSKYIEKGIVFTGIKG